MWCIGLLSRFIYVLYSHHHSVRVVLNPREVLGDARMDRRPAAFAAHRKAIRMDRDQYRLSIFRYRHWTTLIPHASCTILGRGAHIARAQIQREANQTASVGDDARTEVQQTSNRDHLARALTGLAPAGYRRFVVIKRMANVQTARQLHNAYPVTQRRRTGQRQNGQIVREEERAKVRVHQYGGDGDKFLHRGHIVCTKHYRDGAVAVGEIRETICEEELGFVSWRASHLPIDTVGRGKYVALRDQGPTAEVRIGGKRHEHTGRPRYIGRACLYPVVDAPIWPIRHRTASNHCNHTQTYQNGTNYR